MSFLFTFFRGNCSRKSKGRDLIFTVRILSRDVFLFLRTYRKSTKYREKLFPKVLSLVFVWNYFLEKCYNLKTNHIVYCINSLSRLLPQITAESIPNLHSRLRSQFSWNLAVYILIFDTLCFCISPTYKCCPKYALNLLITHSPGWKLAFDYFPE